jgi:hypothetical protein
MSWIMHKGYFSTSEIWKDQYDADIFLCDFKTTWYYGISKVIFLAKMLTWLHVFILYICIAKRKVEFSEEVQVKTIEAPEQLEIDEVRIVKIEIP